MIQYIMVYRCASPSHRRKEVARLPFCVMRGMRTKGFVIDEVAELQRRIPLSPQKGSRKTSFLCYEGDENQKLHGIPSTSPSQ